MNEVQIERSGFSSGVWINGLVGGVTAVLIALVLYGLARLLGVPLLISPPPDMAALGPLPVSILVTAAFVPALVATLLYVALQLIFNQRAARIFQIVAAAVLVISLGGPLGLSVALANKAILLLMHLTTAGAIVWALTLRG